MVYKDNIYLVEDDDVVMTISEFKAHCECGGLVDYDGHGYAIRGDLTVADPRTEVVPSRVASIPPDVTHVVWFNR